MSLLLLIGLRHLKLCTQPVCASPSPAGCIPGSGPRAATSGRWAARGSRARASPELPALPNRRETLACSPCFWLLLGWSNQIVQLIKFHLASKAERRCSKKATCLDDKSSSSWRAVLPLPQLSHLRTSAMEASWDWPSS